MIDFKNYIKQENGKVEESKVNFRVQNINDAIDMIDELSGEIKKNINNKNKLWSNIKDLEEVSKKLLEIID